jgi:hypothetical protein
MVRRVKEYRGKGNGKERLPTSGDFKVFTTA